MEKEPHLSVGTMGLMVATAIFFDVLQGFLTPFFLGWLVGIAAFFTFYIWFKMHGIKFKGTKRIATFGLSSIIEMIPFVSALPAWTFAVVILVVDIYQKQWKQPPTNVVGATPDKEN